MAKKKITDKDGKVRAIKLTGKEAKDLNKALKEEAENHDTFGCEKCKAIRTHKKQENGKWKCLSCNTIVEELDRLLAKGCEWFDRVKGFEEATNKVFGKIKL